MVTCAELRVRRGYASWLHSVTFAAGARCCLMQGHVYAFERLWGRTNPVAREMASVRALSNDLL